MNTAERDAALDGVREELCEQFRSLWLDRCRGGLRGRCFTCERMRSAIQQLRALDDVREQASDRFGELPKQEKPNG